ncbi:hypothetical protein AQI88_22975 [Streptomyces cellostaticus]|uniref:NACHT domain-containing protein n=1 Tax=Streptomyces cellostaticus TaxID=67285 RepID=A0A117PVG6_9ACTN|nr:HEAT repeat domain-containing protein [Streptomyces cellostaticus]KUM94235.1 hypothetical protein AQI88_22975 [Streptomyces cellostaticus]
MSELGWLADYTKRLAGDRVAGYIAPTFHLREAEGDEQAEPTRRSYAWLIEQLSKFPPRTYFVDGVAGSGKSSLIVHVATDLMRNDVVCIRVDHRTLSLGRNALGDPKAFGKAQCPPDVTERPLWKSRVKHEQAVFLVDAVNELQREFPERSPEMEFVKYLLEGTHRHTVLATSRSTPEALGASHLRPIEQLTIAPLTDAESENYLLDCGLDPRPALKEIRATGLDGAIWNPLLLSLLAHLLKSETPGRRMRMPRSRAELLLATVERARTNEYLKAREEHIAQHGLNLEAVLCAGALVIFSSKGGENSLQRKDLRGILRRVWEDSESLDSAIDAFLSTQLVTAYDPGGGQETFYRLLHPSIVDFGLALGWRSSNPPGLAFDLDQCVGDWLGLQTDTESAVEELLKRTPMMRPSLMLDAIVANRGLLSHSARGRMWRALGTGFIADRGSRDDLALSLGRVPFHVVREGIGYGLLHTLQREQPEFALDVIESLQYETLTPVSLQQLKRRHIRLQKNQSPGRVSSNIRQASPTRDVEYRLSVLRSDPNAVNRGSAAIWLVRQAPGQALDPLVDALEKEPVASVRGSVATALGQLADAAAVPALQAALSDEVASVRGSAATALGRLADAAAVPALQAALTDEVASVRGSAATALGRLADASVVPALQVVLTDEDAAVRGSAATALGRLADVAAVPALQAVLADEDGSVRGSAANALGQLADAAAVPALQSVLTDEVASVRGSAATALGRLADASVVPALQAVLADEDAAVRGSAATALGRLADASVVPALQVVLTDEDAAVRGSAATALGQLADVAAVPALQAVLAGDEDAAVRGSAATALARLADAAALPALQAALAGDEVASVRGSAATALGRLADVAAVPALQAALVDGVASVRASAAAALGRVGDVRATESLRGRLEDRKEEYHVRSAAAWALGALVSDAQPWLIPLADELQGYAGPVMREARRFRGVLVNLLSRQANDEGVRSWLERVGRFDPDPLNRTVAVQGLAQARCIDARLIRFLIDPEVPRKDGRKRDTDDGVLGVAGAAVLRMFEYAEAESLRLIPSVVRLLADPETWNTTINAVLAPLSSLPLEVSQKLIQLIQKSAARYKEKNRFFQNRLDQHVEKCQGRQYAEAEFRKMVDSPEVGLAGFRKSAQSRFDEVASMGSEEHFDVVILTAVPVESAALFEELRSRSIVHRTIQRNGRYYSAFDLPVGSESKGVLFAQATDKGGQAAAALTRELIAEFGCTLVLLVGVAGGFSERKVELYDVIVARNVFNYDPRRLEADGQGYRPQPYRSDEQLIRLVNHLLTSGALDATLDGHALHTKDYVSGETVLAWGEAPLRQQLLGFSIDVYGMETEGHGVMHAVWETFKVDSFVGAGVIKCVSDLGDEDMRVDKDEKQQRAARIAVQVALRIIGDFRR